MSPQWRNERDEHRCRIAGRQVGRSLDRIEPFERPGGMPVVYSPGMGFVLVKKDVLEASQAMQAASDRVGH